MPDAQPKYQDLPALSEFDYGQLKQSIAEHGVLEPIVVDDLGNTLDGHHRARACQELGIPAPTRALIGLSEQEKRDYVFMVNIARRQMSIEQKRAMWRDRREEIAAKLTGDLSQSDRAIAREVGAAPDTVAEVRREIEASVNVDSPRRPHSHYSVDPPVYPPDHQNSAIVSVTINYPMESEEERTRRGLPYAKEAIRAEWSAEWVQATDIPDSASTVNPFIEELARHLQQKIRANPFKTMLVGAR